MRRTNRTRKYSGGVMRGGVPKRGKYGTFNNPTKNKMSQDMKKRLKEKNKMAWKTALAAEDIEILRETSKNAEATPVQVAEAVGAAVKGAKAANKPGDVANKPGDVSIGGRRKTKRRRRRKTKRRGRGRSKTRRHRRR